MNPNQSHPLYHLLWSTINLLENHIIEIIFTNPQPVQHVIDFFFLVLEPSGQLPEFSDEAGMNPERTHPKP
jgi:hypothetical protein